MLDIRYADVHNPLMPTRHAHLARSAEGIGFRSIIACVLFAFGMLAFGMSDPNESKTTSSSELSHDESEPSTDTEREEGLLECVVTMNSGRKITGFLIESRDDSIVLRLEGVDTTYQRKNIRSVEFLAPVSERYEELREQIEDSDVETRLILVEWLRAREAYTLAFKELESILEIAPEYPEAKTLYNWLKAYLELNDKTKARKKRSTAPDRKQDDRSHTGIPVLNEQQLNLMRVYELDLRDPPRMIVPDDTLRELMARHPDKFPMDAESRDEYLDLPEHEKLRLLFTHRARDLYNEVTVFEDPAMLKAFRDSVHARNGWLINACASTRCHGGEEAGNFRLVNDKPNSAETAYTNFYIIDHYRLEDGTPLLDLDNPERSALLQLATRPANAIRVHPEVPLERPGARYRPIFRSSRDRKFQQAVDWINSIYRPRVDYDIGYPPAPAPDPADQDQSSDADPQDG